jgi:hypothetical protein
MEWLLHLTVPGQNQVGKVSEILVILWTRYVKVVHVAMEAIIDEGVHRSRASRVAGNASSV